jgi:hypothetical protein
MTINSKSVFALLCFQSVVMSTLPLRGIPKILEKWSLLLGVYSGERVFESARSARKLAID